MKQYQREFIEFCLEKNVLKFGEFKLKSGRVSPYFFNAGLFNDGQSIAKLGEFYAAALHDMLQSGDASTTNAKIDCLFGPAYKGITLVCATAATMYNKYQINLPYVYNRKEAKDHGEGGQLVGAPLKGNILVIDDVITAGTAIREVIQLIEREASKSADEDNVPKLTTVLIALDRKERGSDGGIGAIEELQQKHGIKIISIVSIADVVEYLQTSDPVRYKASIDSIMQYRREYGTA
ncbi:hypothetical protein MIR68_004512 [Amoeboaphelidium protococcarum]|nr:hypothetical protein MIR68_004512 [Amoeboaphelidium protococcarum]